MHPFFSGLDNYEVALLVTTLGVGGMQAQDAFEALGEPLRARLTERAQQLAQMAPEVRQSLMGSELKELMSQSAGSSLELVDPTWLVHRLRGEGPRVVGLVLLGLPAPAMRSALRRLPSAIRRQLPPKSQLLHLPKGLARELRALFATRFVPMPRPGPGPRGVRELLFLQRLELYHLVRDLGFIELGQAFAAVEKTALVELCRRLAKEDAHALIRAVQTAAEIDRPDTKTAQHFLSKVVVNFEDAEEFLQKSGLWRLARATINEPPAWHRAMVQRLPRRVGLLFGEHLARARELELGEDTELCGRLQDAILVQVQLMARRGKVQRAWADAPMAYRDPAACEAALQAADTGPSAAG